MSVIERVAIIGAGNMGSGIAQKTAQEHYPVQLVDRDQTSVNRGQQIIADFLEEAVGRRIFSEDETEKIRSRITSVVGSESVADDTDLVIEAVFEDIDVKRAVFETLDSACGPKTILASNTSSLSIDELAAMTDRDDRFIGLHFFYHPAKNRLVEIIPASGTSEETVSKVAQFCKQLGKVVIVCKDRPGFVVNRFFVPWLNEACLLLEEGVGTEAQIDAIACEAFSIGMGPFALMNLTGPPIALHSTNYLAEQLDTPRYQGAQRLHELVDEGVMWNIDEDTDIDPSAAQIIRERLLGCVFAVADQIVQEDICSMEDVDRGAKVGLRWALGPFELMNDIGVAEAHQMAQSYASLCGDGFAPPNTLAAQVEAGEKFSFTVIDVSVKDGIAVVGLNRPEAMNALNGPLVSQLGDAIERLNTDASVHTIVLEGAGKAFVAGADVKFFVDKIREDAFPDIEAFTRDGHRVLNLIEDSPKTTIALTTGLALGGGLELALACDHRIGTRRTQLRFPETSIGIYPGLGGTQRTVRICGLEAARWAVLAGNWIGPSVAKDLGLVTHLVETSEVEQTISSIAAAGKPAEKYPGSPANPEASVASFARSIYSAQNMARLFNGEEPEGAAADDPKVERQIKALNRAAPIAVRLADELLQTAQTTSLSDGLNAELENLEHIFSTEDALEGLSALIEGRRPTYKNA